MSKDKPEVGDVWIDKNDNKLYIVSIKSDIVFCIQASNGVILCQKLKEYFKYYTYLGEGKANINDLFEI